MSDALIVIGVIAGLILLNGIFTAAEFAIVAAPRTRMAQRAEAGSRSARHVLSVLRDPVRQNRYLATAQIGITVVSLALGMYGEHELAGWLLEGLHRLGRLSEPLAHSIATAVALAGLTYLHVVLGEMIPKSLALQASEATALALARPMGVLERIFLPAVVVLGGLGNAITRALGVRPADARARLMSSEELEVIVDESYAHGELRGREHLFIANIFDFSERSVAQVMTPRNRVIGLPVDANEDEVLTVLCEARFSRYPVYDQDQDHVVGVLHVKDLARWQTGGSGAFDLRAMLRTPVFVPETLGLEEMLARLRRDRSSIAIAFDEFGGTAGVVTFEDIAEEIVGEIRDEFDQEEIAPIELLSAGTARARGDVILAELNQHLGLALEHAETETVAGLVMDLLGRIAQAGDTVTYGGVTFEVEAVDGRAIRTVLVRLPDATRD